jgi:hypothetical protein
LKTLMITATCSCFPLPPMEQSVVLHCSVTPSSLNSPFILSALSTDYSGRCPLPACRRLSLKNRSCHKLISSVLPRCPNPRHSPLMEAVIFAVRILRTGSALAHHPEQQSNDLNHELVLHASLTSGSEIVV